MITGYFFNHIVLMPGITNGTWGARTRVTDSGFCNDSSDAVSTEFDFSTRYFLSDVKEKQAVVRAVDVVLEDLEHLGVTRMSSLRFMIIVEAARENVSKEDIVNLQNMVDERNYDLVFEAAE